MENTQNKKLTGAAAIVMSSIIFSRLTGFVREVLVPSLIGVNQVADAYNIAFKVTGLMYDLLVGGAISAALIPILSGYIAKKDEENGWKAVGTFINVIMVSMVFVCFAGVVFAPQLVTIMAQNNTRVDINLAVELTRILFPSVAFLMMAGLSNGVLNAYQRFAAAAYGPTIYNLGSALSIFLFSKSRWGVRGVAYGVMASAFIYFVFQFSFARRNFKFYRPKFYLKHDGFRKLFKLAIPSLMSSAVVQINALITSSFALQFSAGSLTALNVADRTWQMPYGVFAQGMGIAMLPSLSSDLATGKVKEFKDTLMKGIKSVLLMTIPAGVGFIVLKEPIIRTIFKFTNKFDEEAVITAGSILMFFSIALLSQSIVTILNRAFYADNDTKTPLYIGIGTIVLNMIFSSIFMKTTNLGVSGMALSYSLVSAINAVLLLTMLNKKMKGIYLDKLFSFLAKVIPASLVMGAALFLLNLVIPGEASSKIIQFIDLAFEITVGVVVYFAVVLLLKVEEADSFKNMIVSKLKKTAKRQ
ncbi:murein biosynthesis integral membrane protein MurJ [Acetivibrio cellulolyticus]|uniref:murein biosynthesis integral membrane protein MurJ n=1 Tax=Acetivibrio cellulolyticus TaxID=35830 RepID=UPI0001E2DE68|nr:murein biosynthesis integral membrane protein MurJ [Acetivibrio cellulolyticus]